MKRLKEVYPVSEVLHRFVNQVQPSAKSPLKHSDYRQAYYNDRKLYSYGSHYLMGELHNNDSILLINSHSSSVTTQKHKRILESAASHKTVIYVPYPCNDVVCDNKTHLIDQVYKTFDKFVGCRSGIEYNFRDFTNTIDDYNTYCKAFNIDDLITLDDEFIDYLNDTILYKQAKQKITDDKREIKVEIKRKKNAFRGLFLIKSWKRGNLDYLYNRSSSCIFLRVNKKNKMVETSHGASVSLSMAVTLYSRYLNNESIRDIYIGGYKVINSNNDTIKIGCHELAVKEVERTLSPYMNDLKLVV